ncbi:DUF1661 domain-containing protein [Porphyromonas gingivalis]
MERKLFRFGSRFFCSRTKIKKFSRHVFKSMKQKISRT